LGSDCSGSSGVRICSGLFGFFGLE
jgi:hypothetical protein